MVVVTLKKTTRVVALCLLVFVAYSSLLALNPLRSFAQRYHKAVVLNLRILYLKYTAADLKLDTDETFQRSLDEIAASKFASGDFPELSFINPGYAPPTALSVPSYYHTSAKPQVQPFDPRFTLSAYLHWIRVHPNEPVPFHWSDWVDLHALNKYILLPEGHKPNCSSLYDISNKRKVLKGSIARPVDQYCHDDPSHPLGYTVDQFPHAQTRENMRYLGKSFLYTGFPSPTKLVFMTNNHGSYIVDVKDNDVNDYRNALLTNGMVEEILSEVNSDSWDVLDAYDKLLKTRPPSNSDRVVKDLIIHLEPSMFHVDVNQVVDEIKAKDKLSFLEKLYLESLLDSNSTDSPVKYFDEAKLVNSDKSKVFGEHHDWRFFDGLTINTDKQTLVLHRLIKNYLQFCRSHGLVTWIAHGSLLSWYWNGMAFPWDSDTDAQMPISDLHRLAREFNQSLVIENVGVDDAAGDKSAFNGMSLFFIDVGSSITHRDRGNGMNNIDARFIDVATGLYVDITALSVSNESAPARYDYILDLDKGKKKIAQNSNLPIVHNTLKEVYNCRNRHFSSLHELSPLVLLEVQNQLGYVPQKFGFMLDQEYQLKGFLETNFQDYFYMRNLRIWIANAFLKKYTNEKTQWVENYSTGYGKRAVEESEAKKFESFNKEDHTNLLLHPWIFREYMLTKNFTLFHEKQMKYLLSNRIELYVNGVNQYVASGRSNFPLWEDPFMFHLYMDKVEYADEVSKLLALAEEYAKGTRFDEKDDIREEDLPDDEESSKETKDDAPKDQ